MVAGNGLRVLDPTVEPVPADVVIAPRRESLNGAVVGLLANGKHNAEEMLAEVHGILADRFEFKDVVSMNKGNASRPCPEEILSELQERCDLVITASGD